MSHATLCLHLIGWMTVLEEKTECWVAKDECSCSSPFLFFTQKGFTWIKQQFRKHLCEQNQIPMQIFIIVNKAGHDIPYMKTDRGNEGFWMLFSHRYLIMSPEGGSANAMYWKAFQKACCVIWLPGPCAYRKLCHPKWPAGSSPTSARKPLPFQDASNELKPHLACSVAIKKAMSSFLSCLWSSHKPSLLL